MPYKKGQNPPREVCQKGFRRMIQERGRRNGKRRWATMTQEEKNWVNMKRDYANACRKKRRERLDENLSKHTAFKVPPTASDEEMDDIENFFYGDVL